MSVTRLLRLAVAGFFVLALPVLVVSSTLRYLINEPRFYLWGFARHETAASGLALAEADGVYRQIITYFNSPQELLSVKVERAGQERDLFNSREVIHMKDVKGLIQGVFRVQEVSLALVAGTVIGGFAWRRRAFFRWLAKLTLWGGGLGIGVLIAFGVAIVFASDWVLLWFHLLSFSNPFWMLDPRTDYLIHLFPPSFVFFDAALVLAGATLVQSGILAGLSWAYLRRHENGPRRRRGP